MIFEDSYGFRVPIWMIDGKALRIGLILGTLEIVTEPTRCRVKKRSGEKVFLSKSMDSELKKIEISIMENKNMADSPNIYEDEEELASNLREVGSPTFTLEGRNKRGYRKKVLTDIRGGECEKCGYNKNFAALDFHHPGKKNFNIGIALHDFTDRQFEEILIPEDIKHTILLCANCHRAEHHKTCIR